MRLEFIMWLLSSYGPSNEFHADHWSFGNDRPQRRTLCQRDRPDEFMVVIFGAIFFLGAVILHMLVKRDPFRYQASPLHWIYLTLHKVSNLCMTHTVLLLLAHCTLWFMPQVQFYRVHIFVKWMPIASLSICFAQGRMIFAGTRWMVPTRT